MNKHPLCPHALHYEGVPCFTCKAISAAESAVRREEVEPLVEALEKISNREAHTTRICCDFDEDSRYNYPKREEQVAEFAGKAIDAHRARKEARNDT